MSSTFSNDGGCNNDYVIHYDSEGTMDAAQQAPPSPGVDRDPSATLESSTVLLSQEIVAKTLRESPMQPLETLLSRVCISHY